MTSSSIDLALRLEQQLADRKLASPPVSVLTQLLETMFHASLKTEEGRSIRTHVVYIDPRDPDPFPPRRIRADRWKFYAFEDPILLTVPSLVKAALVSDQRSSSLAVFADSEGVLRLHGLVDQGTGTFRMATWDKESGFDRPGLFHASIDGVGRIAVSIGFEKVAELNVGELTGKPVDIFDDGVVLAALSPGVDELRKRVDSETLTQVELGAADAPSPASLTEIVLRNYRASICRVLLRIQGHRHGGALLLTPERTHRGLNAKYSIQYPRLSDAIVGLTLTDAWVRQAHTRLIARSRADPSDLDGKLVFGQIVGENQLQDLQDEMDGTVWFMSLMSRVDGLVLMDHMLTVHGFGVEITVTEEPSQVWLAASADATSLTELQYSHFGTRHRSMMRYCAAVPGSVGFVVSQDGEVRVIESVNNRLVVWENIQLYKEFPSRAGKAPTKKRRTKTSE